MKKLIALVLILIAVFTLQGCYSGPVLNILNWGEYINEDLVEEFEKEFNVRVRIEDADSNESMYTKIKAQTTKFDIAVPSDYMLHKMYKENLLIELDFDLLPNYDSNAFDPLLQSLRNDYFVGNQKYGVPYFWGSLGIMYNTSAPGIQELVETYEWEVFFNQELTGDLKIGMYNSSRDAVAVALMHLGYDINTTNDTHFTEAENLLKAQNYFTWGTDSLKDMVANGNCDIALVYSGDFFDMLYASLEDEDEVSYNMHVPDVNNIWFDVLVIPTTSANPELAHAFINFMLDHDNALENASEIGYCPTLTSVYQALLDDPDYADVIENYPYYPGVITQGTVYQDLGDEIYRRLEIILSNAKAR